MVRLLVLLAALLPAVLGASVVGLGNFTFNSGAGNTGVQVSLPSLPGNGELSLLNSTFAFANDSTVLMTITYYAVTTYFKGVMKPVTLTGDYQVQGVGQATTLSLAFGPNSCSQEGQENGPQICSLLPPLQSVLGGSWQFAMIPAADNTTRSIVIGSMERNFLGLPYVPEYVCNTPGTCPAISGIGELVNSFNNQTGNVCTPAQIYCGYSRSLLRR